VSDFGGLGRLLIVAGFVLAVLGIVLLNSDKLSWFGRLPGDIIFKRKNFSFYFPLTTSILLSIVLSVIFWLIGRK